MIKNFNFYDVYGYFLPGFTLLALIWLPFGMFHNLWPQAELSSALVASVFGYIVGHLLQILAANAIPSTVVDPQGVRRYPSDIMLDADDRTFSPEFKESLRRRVEAKFGGGVPDRRQEAFLLCRTFLVQHKVASYAEQFEGMYALMRGLTAALVLGAVYHAGWALTGWLAGCGWLICVAVGAALLSSIIFGVSSTRLLQAGRTGGLLKLLTVPGRVEVSLKNIGWVRALLLIALCVLTLVAAHHFGVNGWSWRGVGIGLAGAFLALSVPEFRKAKGLKVWFLDFLTWLKVAPVMFALAALGYSSGLVAEMDLSRRAWLLAIALVSLFASFKFYSSYQYFASKFPEATYRDFVAYDDPKKSEEAKDEDDEDKDD